jgi:hypothetical protein
MDYGTEEGKINRWSIIDHLAQSGVNYLLFYTQQTTIILIKYGRHHIRCKDHPTRATDVHGVRSFVFCVVFCRSLFVLLSFSCYLMIGFLHQTCLGYTAKNIVFIYLLYTDLLWLYMNISRFR